MMYKYEYYDAYNLVLLFFLFFFFKNFLFHRNLPAQETNYFPLQVAIKLGGSGCPEEPGRYDTQLREDS